MATKWKAMMWRKSLTDNTNTFRMTQRSDGKWVLRYQDWKDRPNRRVFKKRSKALRHADKMRRKGKVIVGSFNVF